MTINRERLEYIKFKVNALRKKLHIIRYPIKMDDLLIERFSDKILLRYMDFSETADAVSEYDPESKICVIVVNTKQTKHYSQKRLNFSLAHELGHYILEHHKFYNDNMTFEYKQELEEEANEFAGLFLVNERILRENYLARNTQLGDYFFVSSEVVRIRKSRIDRHFKIRILRTL